FAWTDAAWTGRPLAGGLVYELHIGTFTPDGTLDAAAARLDHLASIGVTHVELLPVNGFNGQWNWGYDGVLWYTVHEAYGGPAAYRRFVDAAHAHGIAVIQDVVYNHLGPSGNYLPEFGPYLRTGSRNTWGDSVNLDEPVVRSYIVENALMWLRDQHVDGLRLDAVHALHDEQPVHILQELAAASDALSAHLGRPLTLIAESDLNDPRLILPREAGGYGLHAQWSDDWHHAVHVALTGETSGYYEDFAAADALPKVWTAGFFHNGTYSSFRGRDHGSPIPSEVPTSRLVTFSQDHDQIGNRAAGDRLTATLSTDRLAVAAVLTLTTPGTPMLFMGEEWGASTPWPFFTSHPEEWLGEAVRKGRTEEFARMGWDESVVPDPQSPATFASAKLDWTEQTHGAHARLLALYRALADLRRARAELTDPAFADLTAEDLDPDAPPAARRFLLGRGALRIAVNLSSDPWPLALEPGETVLLTSGADAAASADGTVTVPPDTAVIVGPPLG
ncbi:malto-oligosyltrehalose trehalohydrolase, partial [Microbacterium sp. Leaf351]